MESTSTNSYRGVAVVSIFDIVGVFRVFEYICFTYAETLKTSTYASALFISYIRYEVGFYLFFWFCFYYFLKYVSIFGEVKLVSYLNFSPKLH